MIFSIFRGFQQKSGFLATTTYISFCSSVSKSLNIAIVGSGPSGFYTAESLINNLKILEAKAKIDIYEKIPVPFGLIRFGVAPDHPNVKKVSNFEALMEKNKDDINFFGNVEVGKHIQISELLQNYHSVFLCYGCEDEKYLNVPGEDSNGVYSSREFIGWLNGHPEYQHHNFDMLKTAKSVTIIGNGNVALDVSRLLLKDASELKQTDISKDALELLETVNIKKVHLVGRRGILQSAFTTKELRENVNIDNCESLIVGEDNFKFLPSETKLYEEIRPIKRKMDLLKTFKTITDKEISENKENPKKLFLMHFKKSPSEIIKTKNGEQNVVSEIKLTKNHLEEVEVSERTEIKAVGTNESVNIPSDIVFRSIGYHGKVLNQLDTVFDEKKGILKNTQGKIKEGLYTTGWIKRGPSGIIGTNKWDSEDTVVSFIENIRESNNDIFTQEKNGSKNIIDTIMQNNPNHKLVNWNDWIKIQNHELEEGNKLGKASEKLNTVKDLLNIVS